MCDGVTLTVERSDRERLACGQLRLVGCCQQAVYRPVTYVTLDAAYGIPLSWVECIGDLCLCLLSLIWRCLCRHISMQVTLVVEGLGEVTA